MLTLVTGSTGLLGNNVVRMLVDRGEAVRVLVRGKVIPPPLADLPVEVVYGELGDQEAVDHAVRGVDRVVHSAGWVRIGWSGMREARETNVLGTRHVAEAALRHQAGLVHVSTVNTLGLGTGGEEANEESPPIQQVECAYVVSKREAEKAVSNLVQRGLHACIVHPGFMLGPWDWKPSSGQMLVEVATRFTPAAPPGGCSLVDVRDVAQGILQAGERGASGRHYVLAGENISYFDLWKMMADVANAAAPRWRMGPVVRFIGGCFGDAIARITGREPLINSAAVRMSAQCHYYSSQRAIDELGYTIRPARESIEAAYTWFKEHHYL